MGASLYATRRLEGALDDRTGVVHAPSLGGRGVECNDPRPITRKAAGSEGDQNGMASTGMVSSSAPVPFETPPAGAHPS